MNIKSEIIGKCNFKVVIGSLCLISTLLTPSSLLAKPNITLAMNEEETKEYLEVVNKNLDEKRKEIERKKRIKSTEIWADNKLCGDNINFLIVIESYGDSYQMSGGIRGKMMVTLKEFTGEQSYNFRNDPRIKWQSDTAIELVLNEETKTLYLCK